jgi:hypothetical protein
LRVAVAEARGQFGNPGEGEHLPLEAVNKGLVKTYQTQKTAVVNSGVCEIVIAL